MDKIIWNESFSVGVALLDQQHKNLVEMINALIEVPGATVRSETVSTLLSRLTEYSIKHFDTKERIFRVTDYPNAVEHKETHTQFRMKLARLCESAMRHDEAVPAALLEFMKEWLEQHLQGMDMEYRPYVEGRDFVDIL